MNRLNSTIIAIRDANLRECDVAVTFLWPDALWLISAVPALAGAYILLLRRRSKMAARFPDLQLIRAANGDRAAIRRHVPAVMFLMGWTAILIAIARPVVLLTAQAEQRTLMLVMDVSLSMAATDVSPSRFRAAQTAAKAVVRAQPAGVRIGILAFSMHADLVHSPSSSREDAIAAIERLELREGGSAIGSGVLGALVTIFSDPDIGANYDIFGLDGRPRDSAGAPLGEPNAEHETRHKPVPAGSHRAVAIVLFSDGEESFGVPPLRAAKTTAQRGIRVFTVGIGTTAGGSFAVEGRLLHASFDEKILKAMAEMTLGQYFELSNVEEVSRIYRHLRGPLQSDNSETEITALLTALGAILLLISAVLSVLWFSREP